MTLNIDASISKDNLHKRFRAVLPTGFMYSRTDEFLPLSLILHATLLRAFSQVRRTSSMGKVIPPVRALICAELANAFSCDLRQIPNSKSRDPAREHRLVWP